MTLKNAINKSQAALQKGDIEAVWREVQGHLAEASESSSALELLAARVLASPSARRAADLQDGLQCLAAALGKESLASSPRQMADLCFAAGQVQQGLETLRIAYQEDLGNTALAHRLGLGELARALVSPMKDTALCLTRWRRALAFLTVALHDRRYAADWARQRALAYQEALADDQFDEAQQRTYGQLRLFVSAAADKAQVDGHAVTAQALRDLLLELEADHAATKLFAEALQYVKITNYAGPLPFGPLWLEIMESPPGPRRVLGLVIEHTRELRLASVKPGAEDWAAATVGQCLRQWYSRLRLVRHALYQGQVAYAHKLLAGLCPSSEGCQVNARPAIGPVLDAPASCDPQCRRMEICNPGYAGPEPPDATLETDAHRLAVQVSLNLAGFYASFRPPRLLEAAQAWLRGRMLAMALKDYDSYVQAVIAQVLGLLEAFWREPELAAALLDRAIAAVPHATLKGRFVDCLTDRGIERWNAGLLEQGSQDLRWAMRLNPHSPRCRKSLSIVLKQLALRRRQEDDFALALDIARELQSTASEGTRIAPEEPSFGEDADWARQRVAEWEQLAARAADPLAWLLRTASTQEKA